MESYAKVTVRVINTADTREFQNCVLTDFSKPTGVDELRVKLFSLFRERLRINDATEMEIGWVGACNKKFVITC